MKIAIVIPARYGSTRFPGKPLTLIGGRTMLDRVVSTARKAAAGRSNIDIMVATEDTRIEDHCRALGVACVMTSADCATGSDRVLEAIDKSETLYDYAINLQGDAPFTPPVVLTSLIDVITKNRNIAVATPVHQLRWQDLDNLREAKRSNPFSGTTCIRGKDGFALWFSKQIIPAIRDEKKERSREKSPVWLHIGVYAYRIDVLREFINHDLGRYEVLEGLEQLRLLENNVKIYTVDVHAPIGLIQAGIDSPEDVVRAETLLRQYGDAA